MCYQETIIIIVLIVTQYKILDITSILMTSKALHGKNFELTSLLNNALDI